VTEVGVAATTEVDVAAGPGVAVITTAPSPASDTGCNPDLLKELAAGFFKTPDAGGVR
jgi:hypothetical protein